MLIRSNFFTYVSKYKYICKDTQVKIDNINIHTKVNFIFET